MGAIINENNTAENGMGVEKGIVGKKSVCGRAAGESRATRRVFVGLILFSGILNFQKIKDTMLASLC